MGMRSRHGFTLVELLVATGVFMIGFSACFGLFLAGMRYRTLAEDTTRMSLAASSLVEELAIGAPPTTPPSNFEPNQYKGSGKLPLPANFPASTNTWELTPYAGVPGTWYAVESCADVLGGNDVNSPTLHLNLIVVVDTQSATNEPLNLEQIYRRMRLTLTPAPTFPINSEPDATRIYDEIIKRGRAMRVSTVVVRRPSWM
jgi:type II secretory pathway pseudopilin PulG